MIIKISENLKIIILFICTFIYYFMEYGLLNICYPNWKTGIIRLCKLDVLPIILNSYVMFGKLGISIM